MELDSTGDQSSIEATPATSRGAILARLIADDKLPQDVADRFTKAKPGSDEEEPG